MSSPSLESIAYQKIWEHMISGQFTPGMMLSENELANRFGMSRTPIRAAISLLEKEGLVASFKGIGVQVKDVTFHEFSEMLEVLIAMQWFVLELASKRRLEFDLDALRAFMEEQRRAVEQGNNVAYYDSYLSFVATILRAGHNVHMLQVLEQCRGKFLFKMVSYRKQYPQYKPHKAQDASEKILAALEQHDLEAAKREMMAHYELTYERLRFNSLL